MKQDQHGMAAPQVSTGEVAQAATEDALDQFCWTVAQTMKRILGLNSTSADDQDIES